MNFFSLLHGNDALSYLIEIEPTFGVIKKELLDHVKVVSKVFGPYSLYTYTIKSKRNESDDKVYAKVHFLSLLLSKDLVSRIITYITTSLFYCI